MIPPEVWLCVFHHATHVPGTLVPDIDTRACSAALRETLVTTRALIRVCKQWWHLAIPFLYRSVYIGRARCLSSLFGTLMRSTTGLGTLVSARPLGEYTQRLDIAIRDHAENTSAELDSLAGIITRMPSLAIVSFAITSSYATSDLPNDILDALQHSAASLRVLDWSSTRPEPSAFRLADLLAKCTQLRILNCPKLVWSKELDHGGIPPTVTTLRLHTLIPSKVAHKRGFSDLDPNTLCCHGPTALQELILGVSMNTYYWADLLHVYRDQLVSVQLYVPSGYSIDVGDHLRLLARTCPRLRRLTITLDRFSSFVRPNLPAVAYLGLRATRTQSPKSDFKRLFALLLELRSSVPSLRVVQLLNEHNVQCLLKSHTEFAVQALQPFMDSTSFRVEDKEGMLLTDRLKALGYL